MNCYIEYSISRNLTCDFILSPSGICGESCADDDCATINIIQVRDPSREYIYKKDRQCHEKLYPFLVQKTLTNQVPFVRPQDPSVKLNNQSQAKLIDLGDP